MNQILVYADSLSWGIIPGTRRRLEFHERWTGVLENGLLRQSVTARVIEDCLNGRRTVWEDPFKSGRNGLTGLAQCIEKHSPLALVVIMLGTNDFQSVHANNAWHSAQGMAALVAEIRRAPIEPGMPVPPVLVVSPPTLNPSGDMAQKFSGAGERSRGLAQAYQQVATDLECHFFDAATIISTSSIDGVHLDAQHHQVLGQALAPVVASIIK